MASAVSGLAPSLTAVPILRISAAISRPCRAIQALCHISMTTAIASTAALNSSWPEPWKASEITPAKAATMAAPARPPPMPMAIQRPRPPTPCVAASTMPTMRPASSTSRKTMINAPSMSGYSEFRLFRDDHALRGVFVILADERVLAGLERADAHDALAVADDDLLDLERVALEFLRRRVIVDDGDGMALAGRDLELGRGELVVLDRQREVVRLRKGGGEQGGSDGGGDQSLHGSTLREVTFHLLQRGKFP